MTGLTFIPDEVSGKRLSLIKSSTSSHPCGRAVVRSNPGYDRPTVSRSCSAARTAAEGTDGTCLRKSYSLPAQWVVATFQQTVPPRSSCIQI